MPRLCAGPTTDLGSPATYAQPAGARAPSWAWPGSRGAPAAGRSERSLRCRAVGALIGELRLQAIDGVAGRRLALAALQHKSCALLLRAQPDARPLAAATRWVVGAAPARPAPHGTGPPALAARLVRNRHGRTGSWVLEWNRVEQRFDLASPYPQPVAEAPADRPRGAARVA